MKNAGRAILFFLISCLLATCFFSSKLTFWVLLAGLCLPLILEILLFLDVRRMRAEVSLASSVPRGTPAAYRLTLNPALTLAAGHLHIRLEVDNHLTGQRGEQTAVFALNRETDLAIELIPECCGNIRSAASGWKSAICSVFCVRSFAIAARAALNRISAAGPGRVKDQKDAARDSGKATQPMKTAKAMIPARFSICVIISRRTISVRSTGSFQASSIKWWSRKPAIRAITIQF